MTDENKLPEQPIEAEVVPTTPEVPKHRSVQVGKLDSLPPELKEEMDTRILSGEAVSFVREDMIKKYPNVEGLKIGYWSWNQYSNRLKGGTQKELKDGTVIKKEMVAALPTAEDLQKAVSVVVNPSTTLENKQEALASLFTKATQRLALLESKQQNFINPDIEALMIAYIKESRALLETVTTLQDTLNKNVIDSFKKELDEYTRVILTTVYASYRLSHPDKEPTSKFDEFRITLENHLSKTLQSYNTTKNDSKN
jgi:hypothetical protein